MMDKDIFKLLLFIDNLLGIKKDEILNISDMEFSNFSENEIKKFLTLIKIVQEKSPEIYYNSEKDNFYIKNYSEKMKWLNMTEKIIVLMFLNKIFNDSNSIKIEDLYKLITEIDNRYDINIIRELIKNIEGIKMNDESEYYLNRIGKMKAHGILSSLTKD